MTVDERLVEIRRLVELGLYAEAYEHRMEVLKPLRGPGVAYALVEIRRAHPDFNEYCQKMASLRMSLLR